MIACLIVHTAIAIVRLLVWDSTSCFCCTNWGVSIHVDVGEPVAVTTNQRVLKFALLQFSESAEPADPDELLVSFCEHSRVLGVPSAATLYTQLRGRQSPEERKAEDAAVSCAREAAAARAAPLEGALSGVPLRLSRCRGCNASAFKVLHRVLQVRQWQLECFRQVVRSLSAIPEAKSLGRTAQSGIASENSCHSRRHALKVVHVLAEQTFHSDAIVPFHSAQQTSQRCQTPAGRRSVSSRR